MSERERKLEAGHYVDCGHPTPPAERDLFSLAFSPFNELLEAFESSPATGPYENVPDRACQIARLILSRTIGFIRLGTPAEIGDAGVELAQSIVRHRGDEDEHLGGYANDEAYHLVSGASVAIGAANRGSYGYELNLLRPDAEGNWPLAARALKLIYEHAEHKDEEEDYLTLQEIKSTLDIEEGKNIRGGILYGLERQGLINEVAWPFDAYRYRPNRSAKELPHVRQLIASIDASYAEEKAAN